MREGADKREETPEMGVGARGGRARQPGSPELWRGGLCDLQERRGPYAEEGASRPKQGSFRVPDRCRRAQL